MNLLIPAGGSPLLTDLYQLTMAYGYWQQGCHEDEAVFQLFFRKHPFAGGYTIAAGLEPALAWLKHLRFSADDGDYLAQLRGADEQPLFPPAFIAYLRELTLSVDIDAVPEGTVVFPNEPLMRVQGPLLQVQLLETALLNLINFQTLIATKAARVCRAAGDDPVLEFGLRRAQGVDGGVAASRAAFIGGCAATSNVLAGQLYGIPVKGTHAHSWVMSHGDELEAFRAYANAMPNNAVFLVDTYNTLQGVQHAITVGRELRERGHDLLGIRLDSGDLAWLSQQAREMLDRAGFERTAIVASNDLDEHLITSLKHQDACIGMWGVGTRLATAYDQPALGGVYKLSAIREGGGEWQPRLKLSEQAIKISNPGKVGVWRYHDGERYRGDVLVDEHALPEAAVVMIDQQDATRHWHPPAGARHEALLVPVMRAGAVCYEAPPLTAVRARTREQLAAFHPACLRLDNPHEYPVGLEQGLHARKLALVKEARNGTAD